MRVTQTAFNAAVFDPAEPAPFGLTGPNGKQAGKRFDVYRNNVAVGLSDALEAAFPVLRKLLGDIFFLAMAGVYLRQHPPTSPLMMHYGTAMPMFLRGFGPVAHLPYLPDIARIEIALRQSYHAADVAPVDPQTLGALTEEQLDVACLRLAPSVYLIHSAFPIHQIWLANVAREAPLSDFPLATDILMTRPHFDPVLHPLLPDASRAMQALLRGETLRNGIAAGGESCDFAGLLGLLLEQRAIIAIA